MFSLEDDAASAVSVGYDTIADFEACGAQRVRRDRDLMFGTDPCRSAATVLYFSHECKGTVGGIITQPDSSRPGAGKSLRPASADAPIWADGTSLNRCCSGVRVLCGLRMATTQQDFISAVVTGRLLADDCRGTIVAMSTEALRTVKDRFSEYVDRVENEHERVVVTRNGRPAIVLISTDDLASLEETISVLSDTDAIRALQAAEAAVAAGDAVRGIDAVRALRPPRQR